MNVVVRPGVSLAEFLSWERDQPQRFEFDGIQPVPMTGGNVAHARLIRRLVEALGRLLPVGYEAFPGDLKVLTPGRARYPDVLVLRGDPAPAADTVEPVAVFEVLSASTALTDLRVKPEEYAAVGSIAAYVILPQDGPEGIVVLRRSAGWRPESVVGAVELPEIGVAIPVSDLYR
ncbi:MAG: Uma2 family endonuclease [Solirubrobacterales bacterium]|nr:Uma2 family endonuclease [Solirubrobacterales bacterium]